MSLVFLESLASLVPDPWYLWFPWYPWYPGIHGVPCALSVDLGVHGVLGVLGVPGNLGFFGVSDVLVSSVSYYSLMSKMSLISLCLGVLSVPSNCCAGVFSVYDVAGGSCVFVVLGVACQIYVVSYTTYCPMLQYYDESIATRNMMGAS